MRIRRWLPVATVTAAVAMGMPVPLASAAGETPANADAPYVLEDGAYPYGNDILAATGASLIAGDGNITHTSCSGPFQIQVWARNLKTSESTLCFKAANTGYLSVNIPRAYRIETVARDIKATVSTSGATQTLDFPAGSAQAIGEGTAADPKQTVLLEMRVTGSSTPAAQPPTGDNPLAFAGKLQIGDTRSCTATLVDPRWVVTAKSCFADKPSESIDVPAGAPKHKTVLTVGRADLATSGGHTTQIVELVPRTDRDLVMARLDQPAFDITPVAVSAKAPAAGEELSLAGFGRTQSEWAPSKLHTAAFSVGSIAATGFDTTAKTPADAAVCKGDAGGSAVRTENGKAALVAVNSRSWQGGCLNSSETRTGAYSTRVDDLGQWIGDLRARRSAAVNEAGGSDRVRWADFDGDRKPDYVTVADNGAVSVWLNKGGDVAGGGGWQELGKVAVGTTADRSRVRLVDFDGDGRFDYVVINANGSVNVWLNRGGDKPGYDGWEDIGQVASGTTTDTSKVRFADWDGDGRTDYLTFNDANNVDVYLNRGGDKVAPWQHVGKVTTATNDRNRVRFADNDGDGKADYHLIKADGKVDLYRNRGGDVVANGWEVVGQIANGITLDHTKVQFVDFTADTHADYILMGADGSAIVYAWNGGDSGNGWANLGKAAYGGV
ncbi:FG-GAP-like repeat-containing protein [Streptomyces sp. NPDC058662]|uniref:FG-GAP-like repeat-containing protein n=1 Tax=Streptomyces sp. NPDC058662 TaxID=3346583 RepID=UPI00364EC3EF